MLLLFFDKAAQRALHYCKRKWRNNNKRKKNSV